MIGTRLHPPPPARGLSNIALRVREAQWYLSLGMDQPTPSTKLQCEFGESENSTQFNTQAHRPTTAKSQLRFLFKGVSIYLHHLWHAQNSLILKQSHNFWLACTAPQKHWLALLDQTGHVYHKSSPLTLRGGTRVNNMPTTWNWCFWTHYLHNSFAGIDIFFPAPLLKFSGCCQAAPPTLSSSRPPSQWELCSPLYKISSAELDKKNVTLGTWINSLVTDFVKSLL